MIKLLVYTDGKPAAVGALRFAVEMKKRLAAELAVITVRSGTHATEEPPPVGIDMSVENRHALPRGLQILVAATDVLAAEGLLDPPNAHQHPRHFQRPPVYLQNAIRRTDTVL